MPIRPLALLACLLALPACTDRTVVEDLGESGYLPDAEARPIEGSLYASCMTAADCLTGLHCFFPQDESGYCTESCGSDPICQLQAGTEDRGRCVGVAGSSATVCAITCERSSCPFDMRCETVEVAEGAARLCF